MFDKLMLMALGKIMYMNKANKSERYFGSIGYPVPDLSNPADHYLQIMAIESYDVADTDDVAEMERTRSMI
jgi:hypothetical protein